MANRWMNQFALSFLKKKVSVFGRVTFGALGAPTLDAPKSIGVTSIVRTGVGKYVVTFDDVYVRWVDFQHKFKNATAPAAPLSYVVSDTIGTATKTMTVQFTDGTGAATDPGAGEEAKLEFTFNDSTAY